jgi:hypothetical protein
LFGATFFPLQGCGQVLEVYRVGLALREIRDRRREVCEPSIFCQLFLAVTNYKLAAGAATLLAGTLPEGAPRNLRMLFSRAVNVKDGPARLKIEKIAAAAAAR